MTAMRQRGKLSNAVLQNPFCCITSKMGETERKPEPRGSKIKLNTDMQDSIFTHNR
jgi:hypothetical protein